MRFIIIISRFLVGVLFIISGLIKANDPIGFSIKLGEYFTVFGTEWLMPLALPLSMFICIFEVVCGVAVLVGSKARFFAWMLVLMIVFFTFLTFYSAYFNKVTDCGCFGDAIKLTPWQSFTKDIILLILIIPIFIYSTTIKSLLSIKGDWILITIATISTTWFTMYCFNHLPVKDFRPYAIGKNIKIGMEIPPEAPRDSFSIMFKYKNKASGKEVLLLTDDLVKKDSVWYATHDYVSRDEKLIRKGFIPPIHDFNIVSMDGNNVTEDVLSMDFAFLLVAYNLDKTDESIQTKVNEFVKGAQSKGIEFLGLTSSSSKVVDEFRHKHQNMFEYYNTDETALKTMIRSNPGLMLISKGTVVAMWHANDFPNFEEVNKTYLKR